MSTPRYLSVMLLARLFESLSLFCPNGSADSRTIAFLTDNASVEQILAHIGRPAQPH